MDWGLGTEVFVSLILLIHSRCHEESLDSAPQPARCQRGGGRGDFARGRRASRERCANCSCQNWFDQ